MSVISAIEGAGKEVVKVVEDIGKVAADTVRILSDAKNMTPEFKAELATLVADAKVVAGVLGPVVATGGTNVAVDAAALAPAAEDIIKLVKDAVAFLPTLEKAVATLKADLQ